MGYKNKIPNMYLPRARYSKDNIDKDNIKKSRKPIEAYKAKLGIRKKIKSFNV